MSQPSRHVASPNALGVTILELVIVVGAGLLLGMVVLELSRVSSDTLAAIHGQGIVQMQVSAALSMISRDARLATRAPESCAPPICSMTYAFAGDSAVDGRAMLLLEVPAVDGGGLIIPSAYDYLVYDFDAATGVLQRIVEAHAASSRISGTRMIARELTRVVFDTVTPNTMALTLWARWTERQRPFNSSMAMRVAFRNP